VLFVAIIKDRIVLVFDDEMPLFMMRLMVRIRRAKQVDLIYEKKKKKKK
jgi:hypothetical protein